MIRISSLLLIALLFSFSPLSAKKAPLFQASNLHEMQAEAHANYQLYFVYVYQEGSRAAKRMHKRTWKDEGLQSYIRKNHLAIALDVNAPSTPVEFIQQYRVFTYPTLLIFSPEGKIMGRTEGYIAPETVYAVLNKHEQTLEQKRRTAFMAFEATVAPSAAPLAMVPSTQMASRGAVSSLPLHPNVRDLAVAPTSVVPNVATLAPAPNPTARQAAPAPQAVSRGQTTSRLHLEVPGMEAFSLRKLERPAVNSETASIGLLIGTYVSYKKLKTEIKQLQRYWRGDIWVYCEEIEAVPVYKIALGNYPNREKAQRFAQAMYKVQGLQSSILDLGLIR